MPKTREMFPQKPISSVSTRLREPARPARQEQLGASIGEADEYASRMWNSAFVKIFIVNMMAQYCVYSMNTLSAPYAHTLGAPATIVGLVSSLFALTALIFKLVSAPAIDSFNRKTVLVLSLCIMLLSFVGYSLSHTIPTLIVSRLLTGVGLAFVPTCCLAIASDVLPPNRMSTGIGYFSLGTVVCQALAPAIGLKLINMIGYNGSFAVFALLMALTIGFACTIAVRFRTGTHFSITVNSIFAREVLLPTIILLLLNMVFCNVNAFLILFGEHEGVGSSYIGYFFTVLAVTMAFTRPMIGTLADKYGSSKVILSSMFFFAVSFLIISWSRTLPMFLLAGFVSAFGYAGCQPALMAVSMKSVPMHRRGAASCTTYIGQDIGNLAGPVLAGSIVESMGYVAMWRIMIIPISLAILIGLFFRKQMDHTGEELASAV
jgi:MFS family permease